jgi:hypothetical protein
MRVVVNGIQKSGTHALLKAVQLNRPTLGALAVEHAHATEVDSETNKHIFIVRHPRNAILSLVRPDCSEQNIIRQITNYADKKDFLSHAMGYVHFLSDPKTLVVRYEELVSNPSTIRAVCAFVGYEYKEGAFEALPMAWTPTNRFDKSDWTQHWTPAIDAVWSDHGLEWERLLGYS